MVDLRIVDEENHVDTVELALIIDVVAFAMADHSVGGVHVRPIVH